MVGRGVLALTALSTARRAAGGAVRVVHEPGLGLKPRPRYRGSPIFRSLA